MPVINGQGFSAEWTPEKQRIFGKLVNIHLNMAYGAMKKCGARRYYYFDLHAGPGASDECGEGSPIIFAKTAEAFWKLNPGFKYSGVAVEYQADHFSLLEKNLEGHWFIAPQNRDNRDVLREYSVGGYQSKFGLVYCDPTGQSQMPFEELAEFSRHWRKADILMALSASGIKRVRHLEGRTLEGFLHTIHKNNWMVREPITKFQWTFVYGTNGPVPEWKREGFYNIETGRGQEILRCLSCTKEELNAAGQLSLL